MGLKEKIPLSKYTHAVRASQAILQYGVGAMVDFPEQTLMTAAPEYWEESVVEIHDERLEKALHVDYFGMPGSCDEGKYHNGVSYARFPEWYFCPKCRKFQPLKKWVAEYNSSAKTKKLAENDPYMVKHLRCPSCCQDLVVARIVVACGQGHIDDFPWVQWVHAKNFSGPKPICGSPSLKFMTSASASAGLEGLTVACTCCNAKTTLKGAFDKDALKKLDEKTGYSYAFRCTGRHPWKNTQELCYEYPHVLQRGGSSVYFPISESSLVIPPYSSLLTSKIQESKAFVDCKNAITESKKTLQNLRILTQEMYENIIKQKISEFSVKIANEIGTSADQVKPILERRWSAEGDENYTTASVKYRAEEYVALNGEVLSQDSSGDFVREGTRIEDYHLYGVKGISLIHKVREVQALVGFSRLEPVESEEGEGNSKIKKVSVKEAETNWYPGYEVRGEGIFIEFDENAISNWRSNNPWLNARVELLNDNYSKSYYGGLRPRTITSKFLLLHTISHLLMKQLSFECGYNIASIKERIYCSEAIDGREMAGILIYTASGDSEGTMGGLVRQGRADTFSAIFRKAIAEAVTCSNDPVCSLSLGQGRDSLNLSACYSCALVPETSCEEFNVFLDRGVVVGTFEHPEKGFYSDMIHGREEMNDTNNENVSNTSINALIISDPGVHLYETNYKDIWKSMKQFCDDPIEIGLLNNLILNSDIFLHKEKPYQGGSIQTISGEVEFSLAWIQSKVLYFASEYEDEFKMAKDGDWNCIYGNDSEVTWEKVRDLLKEV